jgi:hypothetical protein
MQDSDYDCQAGLIHCYMCSLRPAKNCWYIIEEVIQIYYLTKPESSFDTLIILSVLSLITDRL